MKAMLEVDLKPFPVPDTVESVDTMTDYDVNTLSPPTLSMLCDQFRKDVFEAAEKSEPVKDAEAMPSYSCRHCGKYQ